MAHQGQQGPSGGNGGQFYNDDNPSSLIRQIIVHHGAYIDKIEIHYDDGTVFSHGGGGGNSVDVFALNQGDYLTGIVGQTGAVDGDGGPYVCQLGFVSNEGVHSALWGEGDIGNGGQFQNFPIVGGVPTWGPRQDFQYFALPNQAISGFVGNCNKYVDSIGIFTAPLP